MKKIFTLFMTTMMAVSLMAVPQNLKVGKNSKPTSYKQFEAKSPAQAKVLDLHKASMVERDFVRPESPKKQVPLAGMKKVASAKTEVIDLHFDGFSVEPTYYPETGDWYFACSADGVIVRFDILTSEETYCGTWTTEDFDLYYAYMYYEGVDVEYEDIVCTISEEKKGEYLTEVHLSAVIEGNDGNTYNVTCVHSYYQPKATVEHATIADATLEFDGVSFALAGSNENLDLNLQVAADWPSGRFTKGDFLEGTAITYQGVAQEMLSVELILTTKTDEAGNPGYYADLSFYNQDTTLHTVTMVAPLPAPTDTVEISLHNLSVDDSWAAWTGWTYLLAADNDWDVYAGVATMSAEAGTWTGDDAMLYITDMNTYDAPKTLYAEITVSETEDNAWQVLIKGYCDDGKYYVVNMDYVVPEPTVFKTISFDNSASAAFYPDLSNDLQLMNQNDEFTVAVDIYGVPMGENFTMNQVDVNYSGVIDNGETVLIADVSGKVYQVGDTTRIDAVIIGFNAVQYNVELWYAVPTPTETVEFTVEGAEFVNYIADQGLYQLYGYAENGVDFVSLALIADEVAGTYINDGVFGRFGAEDGHYDLYTNYNYVIKVIDPETEEFEKYMVEKGTVVVTVDENNQITAVADVICSNAVHYVITVTSEVNNHLLYDADEPLERVFTSADVLEVTYMEDYGYVYVDLWGEGNTDIAEFLFFVEEPDADIVVPEGTYTIDDSMDYGTVLASSGVSGGSVYPSFYAFLTEDGYLVDPLWFMVSGTVTVEKVEGQLKLEATALNSYDQTIHIVYDPVGNGVEDIYTNATTCMKQIIDGQLVIIRNGKAFNAMGAQVK